MLLWRQNLLCTPENIEDRENMFKKTLSRNSNSNKKPTTKESVACHVITYYRKDSEGKRGKARIEKYEINIILLHRVAHILKTRLCL